MLFYIKNKAKPKLIFLLFVFIWGLQSQCFSQLFKDPDRLNPRFGIFGNAAFNWHYVDLNSIPEFSYCCKTNRADSSLGYSFGLTFDLPLNNWLLFGIRASYNDKSAVFTNNYNKLIENGQVFANANVSQRLQATLTTFSLSPIISLRLIDRLFLHAGAEGGVFIDEKYLQEEKILTPVGYVFPQTGKNTQNVGSGTFSKINSFDASAVAGISYEFLLNRQGSLLLSPEIFFNYGLTSVLNELPQNNKWLVNSLHFGISLKYSPERLLELKNINYKIDTLVVHSDRYTSNYLSAGEPIITHKEIKSKDTLFHVEDIYRVDTLYTPGGSGNLSANINVFETDSIGRKLAPVKEFKAKVQLRRDVYPLLPYVFFGSNSSEIPDRYIKVPKKKAFSLSEIEQNSLIFNHNVLNIIASRLLSHPNSTITLAGFTDPATEKINCSLAHNRALAVKDYIVNTFDIRESRILVAVPANNCYPEDRTLTNSEMGYSENRRVEITSNDPEILAPVQGQFYLEPLQIEPALVLFDPQGSSKETKRWSLAANIYDKLSVHDAGKGSPSNVYYDALPRDFRSLSATAPISISYKVFDNAGNSAISLKNVDVVRDTVPVQVERLVLPLFDVSKFIVERLYFKQIQDFLKNADKSSTISITGYCDILGNEKTNQYLSEMRAREISNTVRTIMPLANIVKIEGMGATKFPLGIYSYSTPEERFLCRTVEIEIMKPAK